MALRKGMVNQLPTPKPKKTRPELHFISLIVQDAKGALLLQLQAEKGVWQSLWTPPFAACSSEPASAEFIGLIASWLAEHDLAEHADAAYAQIGELRAQPWLVHDLTHRKMHFKVLGLKLPVQRPDFFPVAEKPVPKIVNKLIVQLDQLTQGAVPKQNALDF